VEVGCEPEPLTLQTLKRSKRKEWFSGGHQTQPSAVPKGAMRLLDSFELSHIVNGFKRRTG